MEETEHQDLIDQYNAGNRGIEIIYLGAALSLLYPFTPEIINNLWLLGLLITLPLFAIFRYVFRHKEKLAIPFAFTAGLLSGFWISEATYSLWPSLILISTLLLHHFSQGGYRLPLILILGTVIAIAIYFLLNNPQLPTVDLLIDSPLSHAPLFISAFIYLCGYGLSAYRQKKRIDQQLQTLGEELKAYKLRAYELSGYLPKPVWRFIEGKRKAKIERKPITIFFSDIVGFSSLSEELEAETLSNVLSSYLSEMSKVVEQYNGTIDKFIGDAIMVTFGDDRNSTQGVKKDAIACVSMALAMNKKMHELQPMWDEMGIKRALQIRMGINSGYCTVGTFGTNKHLDHTALGVHVNLASRLESAGQPGEILVSHETWNLIKDTIMCKDKGKIKAKGFTHPVQVFQVINHRSELGSQQSYFSQMTEGFSMHMDVMKIKNYDREKVLSTLEVATKKLKERVPEKS